MHHLRMARTSGFASALLLTGMTASAPARAETINIGVLVPLTGRNAVQGKDILRGIKLATERINNGYEVPMKDGSTVKVDAADMGGELKLIVDRKSKRLNSSH